MQNNELQCTTTMHADDSYKSLSKMNCTVLLDFAKTTIHFYSIKVIYTVFEFLAIISDVIKLISFKKVNKINEKYFDVWFREKPPNMIHYIKDRNIT